jgi:hypothetical protein
MPVDSSDIAKVCLPDYIEQIAEVSSLIMLVAQKRLHTEDEPRR